MVDSQKFILGEDVKKLEEEIAAYSGTKYAIGCASGSDALMLALMALDVAAGRRSPDDALHVLCDCRSDFARGRGSGFRGRRRGHVQSGREPDGRGAGGASQGSRDHSGAPVRRLRRHGPDHGDGERARDSGDRRRGAIDRLRVQRPPGRQYRTDRRFQLFPEQEPGRVMATAAS